MLGTTGKWIVANLFLHFLVQLWIFATIPGSSLDNSALSNLVHPGNASLSGLGYLWTYLTNIGAYNNAFFIHTVLGGICLSILIIFAIPVIIAVLTQLIALAKPLGGS